ncbi:MAG: leucine-rich repeat domain-containing protein [Patescibacteria group bacterium]|jgi:Leucine-rich repeat (LRR) protein
MKNILIILLALAVMVLGGYLVRRSSLKTDTRSAGNADTSLPNDNTPAVSDNPAPGKPASGGAADQTAGDPAGNFGGRGLTEFPREALADKNIKKLVLSGNKLKTLPSEIGELQSLEELYLDNNNLEGALPAEIRKMAKLRILDAHNNNLTGIPAEIGQLKNLRFINFSGNEIDTMPNEIENIKDNLQILNLSENKYNLDSIKSIEEKLPNTQVIF